MEVQMTEGQVPAGYVPQAQTAIPTENINTAMSPRGEMGAPMHQHMNQVDPMSQQQNNIPAAGDAQFYQQQYEQQQEVYKQQQLMQQQQFQNLQKQFQPVQQTAAAQQKIIEQKQQTMGNQQPHQMNQQYMQQPNAPQMQTNLPQMQTNSPQIQPNAAQMQRNPAQMQQNAPQQSVIPSSIGNLVVEGANFQNMGQLVIDQNSMPMNMKIPNPGAQNQQMVPQNSNQPSNMAQGHMQQNSAYISQQNAQNISHSHSNPQSPRQHMTLPHTPQNQNPNMQQPNNYMHQQNMAQNMMQNAQMASPRQHMAQNNAPQLSTPYGTAAQPIQPVHQQNVGQNVQQNQYNPQVGQQHQVPIQPANPQLQQMQHSLVSHQQHYLQHQHSMPHQHAMPQQPYQVRQPVTPNELRTAPNVNPYAKPISLGNKQKCNGLQDLDDKRGMWYGS